MTVIHELQQILWVSTPHGDGQVLFLMDYGVHENTIFVVALEESGIIKHYNSNDVRLCKNNTIKMNVNEKN